jgi:predicted permease
MPDDYWRDVKVTPLREVVVGSTRPALLVLFAAVTLMLLIACANVATLLLAREAGRRRELAVRSSLGAGRRRLVRQLLTESLLLAGAGMALGLGIAVAGVRLLRASLPADTPRLVEVGVDARVLAFALGVTLMTALLFGILPAIRATGAGLEGALRDGGRGGTGARQRLTSVLVVIELALAMTLVTGAGLLVRSLWRLQHTDPGFRAESLVTLEVSPSTARFPDDARRREFFRRLLERARSLPDARASLTSRLPFGRGGFMNAFLIEGRPDPSQAGGDYPLADVAAVVDTGYLHTLGVPVLRGRGLEAEDGVGAPGAILVSESLARKYWPQGDALGARVNIAGEERWRTVAGVVADSKWASLSEGRLGAFFIPLAQGNLGPTAAMVVRTSRDPKVVAAELRAMVRELDPAAPVSEVHTMEQLIDSSVARPRLITILLAGFAGVALLLGVLGIYGVVSYGVRQRTREFGIRMALGASASGVLRIVVGRGLLLALSGAALGLLAAAATTRVLRALLVGVSAHDPLVFAVVPPVLLGAALLGTLLPARRATRVDPMVVLREE